LKRLQRELGIGFIHVSNSQDEAMALIDIAPVFIGGRKILRGPRGPIANRCRLGAAGDGPRASPPSTIRAARFASLPRSAMARTSPSSSATRLSPPSPARSDPATLTWRERDAPRRHRVCMTP
jgi:hypothetical protein